MGEARSKRELACRATAEVGGLELPTGKVRVLWDQRAAATPLGQMPYFIEFLHLSGLWQRWLDDCLRCPLNFVFQGSMGMIETWKEDDEEDPETRIYG